MTTIRPATAADVAGIRAAAAVTWRATYAGLVAAADVDLFLDRAYGEESVARTIARLAAGYLVALDGEAVVGYAFAGENREGEGELFAIYVLPERQGSGVGRALWREAAAHLSALGFGELTLWVAAGNVAARRFYERRGAVAVADRVDLIGASRLAEVRYVARLELAAPSPGSD